MAGDPSSMSMPPPAAPSIHSSGDRGVGGSGGMGSVPVPASPLRSPRQSPYRAPQSIHPSSHHSQGLHSGPMPMSLSSPCMYRGRDRSQSLGSAGGLLTASPSGRVMHTSCPVAAPTSRSSSSSPICVPFVPNLVSSLHDNHAVEAAIEAERSRVRELEKDEANMSAEQLRLVLKRERAHSSRLAADLAALRSASVRSQAEAEAHEEGRINGLMRRLECLQREKGRIIVELEREEEMLTNTLQKKLNELRREKHLLEQQIEREHNTNSDLKTKLSSMAVTHSLANNQHNHHTQPDHK